MIAAILLLRFGDAATLACSVVHRVEECDLQGEA